MLRRQKERAPDISRAFYTLRQPMRLDKACAMHVPLPALGADKLVFFQLGVELFQMSKVPAYADPLN